MARKVLKRRKLSRKIESLSKHSPSQFPEIEIKGEEAESVAIIGDLHANYIDPRIVKSFVRYAEENKCKVVVIAGDFLNADAFSTHPPLGPQQTFADEVEQARKLLEIFGECFDKIYWIRGNHDHRVSVATFGQLNMTELADLVCGPSPVRRKITVTPYSRLWVRCSSGLWLIAHQREYSKIKLRVASALSAKYNCHVICAHQHHCAVGLSENAKFVVADLPCACRYAYYKSLDTSSRPDWCLGFGALIRGKYHMVVNDSAIVVS